VLARAGGRAREGGVGGEGGEEGEGGEGGGRVGVYVCLPASPSVCVFRVPYTYLQAFSSAHVLVSWCLRMCTGICWYTCTQVVIIVEPTKKVLW
jgi:hypothetical protein